MSAKMTPKQRTRWIEQLHLYYDPLTLAQWISRAKDELLPTKPGQLQRWQNTLRILLDNPQK